MPTDTAPTPRVKPPRIGRVKITANVLVQLFICFLILLMVNYLSFNHFRRWDFTRNHFYALSGKTRQLLSGLKKKVKVYIVFPGASDIYPDVTNLLKEYQYNSNGKLEVEIIDPFRDQARAQDLQNKYKFGNQENIIIFDNDGRKKLLGERSMVNLDTSGGETRIISFKGEEAVTGALMEITNDAPNILYALAGHQERDINGDDLAIVKGYIERENVKVQPLSLDTRDAVPDDAGLLLILGARYDLSEREVKIIGDYWDKKGRILVLLDPNAQKQTPNLMAFLATQGIRPEDDRILRVERTQIQAIAALVRDVTAGFVDGSPITQNLKNATGLFLGATQSLTLDGTMAHVANTQLLRLAQASPGYWGETNYDIKEGDPVPVFLPNKDFGPAACTIAASAEKGALKDVQVRVDTSRMVVVGNCQYVSKESLSAPNLDFTVNSVDWLLDRAELIGIAPKDYTTLTLTLTDKQMSQILTTTMFIIPGIVGLFGLGTWWRRRH